MELYALTKIFENMKRSVEWIWEKDRHIIRAKEPKWTKGKETESNKIRFREEA